MILSKKGWLMALGALCALVVAGIVYIRMDGSLIPVSWLCSSSHVVSGSFVYVGDMSATDGPRAHIRIEEGKDQGVYFLTDTGNKNQPGSFAWIDNIASQAQRRGNKTFTVPTQIEGKFRLWYVWANTCDTLGGMCESNGLKECLGYADFIE